MAPFGDGGGGGGGEEGDAAGWGWWDPMRSGSAPPTMEGAAAAREVEEGVLGGGGGGGGSFFSGAGGLGARRLEEVGRWRGAAAAQEHFGNSASLSNGQPGLQLNGTREFDGQQFGPTGAHSVGAMVNHSPAGSAWIETKTNDAEFHRHTQSRFIPSMGKMNAFAIRDLKSAYLSDSDLSTSLSRVNLSNHVEYDEGSLAKELLDEMEMRNHKKCFSSKIADGSRSPLPGNAFCKLGSEHMDIHSLPTYGDGVLYRQNSNIDSSYVSRNNDHHVKSVECLSLADQLALMQLSNLHEENNYHSIADMVNLGNPLNRCNVADLDLARYKKQYLGELFAHRCLPENIFLPKCGPSYNDNIPYHDEPRFPFSRIQRPESHIYSHLRGIPYHGDQQQRLLSSSRRTPGRNMGSQIYQGNLVGNGLDASSLDIADRNGAVGLELINVVGHVMEVSMDQYGSRFIQQKLENASPDDRERIFPEILTNAIALTTDVFGNYVIQKFFEFATESQLSQLADQLRGRFLELSFQMYGCRVVQKVIDVVDLERKISIVGELKDSVLRCISDQNGNHVIQKCIECVPEDHIPFVVEDVLKKIYLLCTHQYGCRVIQRVLEHCHNPATQTAVMFEIVERAFDLTEDKFGNYVVQHVLQHGKPEERSSIIQKLSGHVVILSQQKYASNVVEKCLSFGTPDERDSLIREIVSSGQTFQALMKDQFGNYVVQRVLQTCDDKFLEVILSSIKMHLNELKNYTFGKHIVARVEKLIITGENRVRMGSKTSQCQQSPNCTDVDANPF